MKKVKSIILICVFVALIIPIYTAVRAADETEEKENTVLIVENK